MSKIGSIVSIITKAESRYQGTLIEIDRTEKTMTLENVTSHGTEGRRNGVKEIQGNDQVMGMIKFAVDKIKDIKIVEGPPEDEEDDAIVETKEEVK